MAVEQFRATAGYAQRPDFLSVDRILGCFEAPTLSQARRRYVEFVLAGLGRSEEIAKRLWSEPAIGETGFLSRYREGIEAASSPFREVPRKNRFVGRPDLATLLAGTGDRRDRDQQILKAHSRHGYTVTEIARFLGIHRTTVSRILRSGSE